MHDVPRAEYDKLYGAALAVANAINAGLGGHIAGTLMEKELRDALGLKPGEWIARSAGGTSG